jgi:fibronectin-binding autotransporter adhesin
MSEVVYDDKFTTIELSSDLGLNFSSSDPRIKHTGTGTFTIESTIGKINITSGSTADDSLNLDSAGGIDLDGAGEVSIETSDIVDGIKIGETTDVPVDIAAGGGTFLLGKLGETAQHRGSVTIAGDLTVNGDSITTNVIINETEDPMLRLNEGATGSNTVDIGFLGDRGDDANIGFFWDESADEFALVSVPDSQLELTGSTQNTTITDYVNLHGGTCTLDDDLYVGSSKFSVIGATGNTLVNAGTFTVTSTTDAAQAIRLNTNGGTSETITVVNTQGTAEAAIALTSTAGGIDINAAAGKNITVDGGQLLLTSADNAVDAIYLRANGGTSETVRIHSDQGTSVMTDGNSDASVQLVSDVGGIGLRSTANLVGSIQIEADGGTSETIVIHADQGTAETSIQIISDAGGIDMNAAAGKNITIDGGQLLLTSADNAADAIYLRANGGTSETVRVHSDQGTSVMTDGNSNASVQLVSDAGGIGLRSTANLAGAVQIEADGGTSETIIIHSDQGTAETSIQLTSDAGGIYLNAAAGKNVAIDGGQILIASKDNASNAIQLLANQGTSEQIAITNTQGTGEGAITITSTAGGIDLNAAAGKNATVDAGQILLTSADNATDAIYLRANGGISETVRIHADQGTSVMTDGNSDASVQLVSDAGGIGIRSTANLAGAVQIEADGGTSETIIIHSDQGTAETSIQITSDAGGIDIDAAAGKNVDIAGGQVLMESKDNGTDAIRLLTNQGTSERITITNTLGTSTSAIDINATAGGIDMDADDNIALTSSTGDIQLTSGSSGSQSILIDAPNGGILGRVNRGHSIVFMGEVAGGANILLTHSSSTSNEKLTLRNNYGTAADAVNLTTTTGGISLDSIALSIDSTDTTNLTMTANNASDRTLTIAASNSGGGEGLLSISSDAQVDVTDGTLTLTLDGGALSETGLTSTTLTGSGAMALGGSTMDIDATSTLQINSSGGTINIGNDSVSQAINIGTSGTRTVTLGTTTTTLDVNTAGVTVDGTTVSVDGTDTMNFSMTASDGGNKILTVDASNSGGGEGRLSLSADNQVDITDGTGTLTMDGGVLSATSMSNFIISEASFTPAMSDASATNFTMTFQFGRYTRIGDCYFFTFRIVWSGKNSATAGEEVRFVLPTTTLSTTSYRASFACGHLTGVNSDGGATANADNNEAYGKFFGLDGTTLLVSDFATSGEIQVSGFFYV